MPIKGTITVAEEKATELNNASKKIIFKNCVPFTNSISRINNTQVDNTHDVDAVMPMYNLTGYCDNYSKTSGILWQYSRDEPAINVANSNVVDFNANNATADSFKIKEIISGEIGKNGTKNAKIMVPLKSLSSFWRTLEMYLINCEINLDLNWSR